jgi:serine/threonine protein kinase
MSGDASQSVLCKAALASGLVSAQQLEEVLASLAASPQQRSETVPGTDGGPAACPVPTALSDEQIGQRFIEAGYLNRWQVEQLKEGRTKFTLGPYRIVNAIGRGGMGHVFKAEHKLLGRVEAIKVLPKAKSTPEAIAAFEREIRAQAQLDHPNLVRITYADFEGDTYFFVTEYVPGTDLRRLVRRNGPLPYSVAATIISQAAEALHYAHRRGLVHRDVKPGNLLVTPEGRTKITDLGLAWFSIDELDERPKGKSHSVVGTADYLAPESIRNPDQILPVSDVYSLGCTLYYAVTGKVPFPGGNTSDKLRRHLDEAPLNPLHFNPDLPEAFCDAIAAMMNKNPDLRTHSAAAVVELLRPWCDEGATQDMAGMSPTASSMYYRTARAPSPPGPALEETASFVLDEAETAPGQIDSPSQISQGTVSITAGSEDTLPQLSPAQRSGARPVVTPGGTSAARATRWPVIALLALAAAAIAALSIWLF